LLDAANSNNVSDVSEAEKPGSTVYGVSTTVPVRNVSGGVDAEGESKNPELRVAASAWCPRRLKKDSAQVAPPL
jgi:hypothetical protein